MTRHTSDINSHVLNISYPQISFYLEANGWIHEKTIADIDIYSFEFGQSACKMLLPHDDQSEDYKHRLADILLIPDSYTSIFLRLVPNCVPPGSLVL